MQQDKIETQGADGIMTLVMMIKTLGDICVFDSYRFIEGSVCSSGTGRMKCNSVVGGYTQLWRFDRVQTDHND